ncbi:hypothetical protein, conserved [Leishmania tarentolae]|uniref:Uncharacterized protein n=1 Tax=Leishmania tarentolae TaxID=5689 RepID=A0A640KMJ3_LEITA|nr:hypothetical protein, conserved [Leishmania tarentolae]
MERYEDSFESSTTAIEVEEESRSVRTSSTTATSGDCVDADNEDSVGDIGVALSDGKGMSDVLPLGSNATVPPTARNLALPLPAAPVPVPVPVPVPLPTLPSSPSSMQKGESQSGLHASSISSAHTPLASQKVLELSPDGTVGEREKEEGNASLAEGTGAQLSTTRDASNVAQRESVETPSEDVDRSPHGLKGVDFEALSHFVAFGGSGSDGTTGPASHRQSSMLGTGTGTGTGTAGSLSPLGHILLTKREAGEDTPKNGEKLRSTEDSLVSQPTSPQQTEFPQKTTESNAASVGASSIFSTLSQHLQQQKLPHQQPHPTLEPPPLANSVPVAPLLPPPATTLPTKPSASVKGTPATPSLQAPASLSLPALPPPAWSSTTVPNNATVSVETLVTVPPTATAKDATTMQQGWMIGGVQYRTSPTDKGETQKIPPLPPSYEQQRSTLEQTRTSSLLEASEAVERLVKAFAILKGYNRLEQAQGRSRCLTNGVDAPAEAATTVVTSARQARVASTVQVRDTVRRRGSRVVAPELASAATASVTRGSASRQKEIESVAEGVIMDCVLSLLQERTRSSGTSSAGEHEKEGAKAMKSSTTSTWRAARPHYEVVTADAFSYGGGASNHCRASHFTVGRASVDKTTQGYLNSSSTFLGGLQSSGVPLFDPRDLQSAVDLYNGVREALDKYVLRRVATGLEKSEGLPSHASQPRTRSITAIFAWALLLDMVNLCEEIARGAYDAVPCTPSAVYPVLAQFRGDAACEEVAKAAMHCLPFEALDSSRAETLAQEDGGCTFRMACWVTKQQLWTIADALTDTVREDMVRRAKVLQYSPFNVAAVTEVDPRVLVPPTTPMLTLLPLSGRRGGGAVPKASNASAALGTAASYARVHRGGRGEAEVPDSGSTGNELFEVPAAAMQKMAYHISVLTTDLLSDMGTAKHRVMSTLIAEDYPDVATAVAETMGELLQDESIRGAVRRRAAEKVKQAQRERADFLATSRQRKEQAIIEKAEKEAEEVVQHILQEMRAQGVA